MAAFELLTGKNVKLIEAQVKRWLQWTLKSNYPDRAPYVGHSRLLGKLIKPVDDWSFYKGKTEIANRAMNTNNVVVYGFEVDMLDSPADKLECFDPLEQRFVLYSKLNREEGIALREILSFVEPEYTEQLDAVGSNLALQEVEQLIRGLYKSLDTKASDAKILAAGFIAEYKDALDLANPDSDENIRLAIRFLNKGKSRG